MKIVSLNIRHGGGGRIPKILDWLARTEADCINLCEWRANTGGHALQVALNEFGYQTAGYSKGAAANGILVATRSKSAFKRITPKVAAKGEVIKVTMDSLCLLCGYFPQKLEKKPFFETVVEEMQLETLPTLLIGDLNTGRNDIDLEVGATPFFCADDFINIETYGVGRDLWRLRNGTLAREWSWHSGKNGFRIDHAFGNAALTGSLADFHCYYDHSTRLRGLSDHSALLVDLKLNKVFPKGLMIDADD